jgi:hypothetical protein
LATKQWESIKRQYCDKAGCQVALQAQIIYPIDYLPDNPRILGERCSHGDLCLKERLGSCAYSGGDPDFDPFNEQQQSKK